MCFQKKKKILAMCIWPQAEGLIASSLNMLQLQKPKMQFEKKIALKIFMR